MGKSAKKSTKVDAAAVATAPVISAAKGKRGAEKVVEKVSAKKLKKNDGTAQAIEKLKNETKTQKKSIKKKESSSSEDESSESEEEQIKAVKPSTNKHAVATNGSAKKDKRISSSESDSSDDSDSEKDTKPKAKAIAPSVKKTESSSDSDSSDDSDSEEDTKPKAKVIAPVKKVESSSDSDSDSGSDSDVPKAIQGKKVASKVASKADTSSDSSSEEDNDKKTTVAVKKPSAAAKKKDDSSSDEDDDTSSEDSSEEDKTAKVAKVPITGSKNVPVASKNTESSDSSDDSESDEEQAAKKPTSAAATKQVAATKQSEQSSDDEESSEDDDEDDDEDEKPSKGQKKNEKDVEMVDAVTTPKTVKKAPQTPVTTTPAQSGGSKTLFVGNLPYNVEQADVENFFKDCKVAEVRFSSDRDGNFRGYGHVEFATEEDAQKALALNGEQLSGRELKLDMARERGAYTPGNERTPFQKAGNAQGSTMFVGGIDRNSGEDEVRSVLEKHFAACGELTRVSIPPDRDNGGLRGIAYIDFTDSAGLNKALELGGPEFNGYTLKVDEAKPRDNSNGGGGRSGGRSGGGRFGRSGGRDGGGRSGGRFGRSGGRDGGRGGRRGGFNSRPNLAAAGTGKKTTFDD